MGSACAAFALVGYLLRPDDPLAPLQENAVRVEVDRDERHHTLYRYYFNIPIAKVRPLLLDTCAYQPTFVASGENYRCVDGRLINLIEMKHHGCLAQAFEPDMPWYETTWANIKRRLGLGP